MLSTIRSEGRNAVGLGVGKIDVLVGVVLRVGIGAGDGVGTSVGVGLGVGDREFECSMENGVTPAAATNAKTASHFPQVGICFRKPGSRLPQ